MNFTTLNLKKEFLNKNKNLIRVKKKKLLMNNMKYLKKYLNFEHLNGGMSDMDAHEFSSMIEETNVDSEIFEYWELKKMKENNLLQYA